MEHGVHVNTGHDIALRTVRVKKVKQCRNSKGSPL